MAIPSILRRPDWRPLILAALLGAFSCKQETEPKPLTSEAPSAKPTGAAAVNPEIAEAVAQAAQAPSAAAASEGENAPPENGILDLSRADREVPSNAPAKVVLGQAGSEPRLLLGGPETTAGRIGQLKTSVRTGPQTGMPSVDFRFDIEGKDAEGGGHVVSFEIVETALAENQLGQIPEQMKKLIETMKGSALSYRTQDGVRVGDIEVSVGKKTDANSTSLLAAAADALTVILMNYPKEPVGQGGFWMVTARERLALADVIGYHLVKVESIDGQRATLSVNTKRYLVGDEFQGLTALQYAGSGSSDLVVMPGHKLPIEGRTQQSQQAVVQSQQGPRPIQYELRGLFAFPPKLDGAPASSVGTAAQGASSALP